MTLQFSEKDFQGYQTPMEEPQPPFARSSPPTPATAPTPNGQANQAPTPGAAPEPSPGQNVSTPASAPARPSRRPPLLQLSSYYHRRTSGQSDGHVVPTLDDLLHKGVRRPRGGKVGIRDRIACYQWTFFTMVSSSSVFPALGRVRWREEKREREREELLVGWVG